MKRNYKSRKTNNKRRGRQTTKSRNYKSKSRKLRKSNTHRLRKYIIILIAFILLLIYLYNISPDMITLNVTLTDQQTDEIRKIVQEEIQKDKADQPRQDIIEDVKQEQAQTIETQSSEVVKEQQPVSSRSGISRDIQEDKSLTGYRITSYHPGDGCATGTKTGSGLKTSDFNTMKIGNKNVYTYKGKIVVACATKELKATGYNVKGSQEPQVKHYFKYFDELQIVIDGVKYNAICLDSCGASMWKGEYRIDIFVPSSSDVINRSNVTAYYM